MAAENIHRRQFFTAASIGGIALSTAHASDSKLALLGGKPARTERFPSWPVTGQVEDKVWMETLHSGKWYRGNGKHVDNFEEAYARLTGAKHCLATANGTSALFTSLNALGAAPGDEVIVPPYTFVATINAVLLQHALPVFVDSDLDTFQIDAHKIEAGITPRTTVIMPVHLGGSAADLDTILAIAKQHKIPVLEDACQAHLAEWRGRKLGTWGAAGCFSFQASKNLNSGEGGAILSDDADFIERCYTFHNNGRSRKTPSSDFAYYSNGANLRMTEFQAALLIAQASRVEDQSKTREQNAQYLTSLLKEIPGIRTVRMYDGCTRNAYHLYMFRYQKEQFAERPRSVFLKALRAEGIPCSGGYSPLNKEPFLKRQLSSRAYQRLFPGETLAGWEERTHCPVNDRLCQEGVWFTQTMLLGARRDMEQIAEAIAKIQKQAAELPKG